MTKNYSCPDCGEPLEEISACGAESYFCNKCKKMISRSRIKGHPNNPDSNKENASV